MNTRNFPRSPVVKNPPCNAGDVSSHPAQGTKIPHAVEQLSLGTTAREPTRINKRSYMIQRRSHVPQLRPDAAKLKKKLQRTSLDINYCVDFWSFLWDEFLEFSYWIKSKNTLKISWYMLSKLCRFSVTSLTAHHAASLTSLNIIIFHFYWFPKWKKIFFLFHFCFIYKDKFLTLVIDFSFFFWVVWFVFLSFTHLKNALF